MLKSRDDSQSEFLSQPLRRMDCRIKSGNDEVTSLRLASGK
jgi:hypothetical protein